MYIRNHIANVQFADEKGMTLHAKCKFTLKRTFSRDYQTLILPRTWRPLSLIHRRILQTIRRFIPLTTPLSQIQIRISANSKSYPYAKTLYSKVRNRDPGGERSMMKTIGQKYRETVSLNRADRMYE